MEVDSIEVADKVSDRLGGQVNLVKGRLLLHEIVLETLRVLEEFGFMSLEEPE